MTSMCNLWCFLCCSACWSSSWQEGIRSSQGLPGEHLRAPRHRKNTLCPPTGVLGAPKLETPTPECLSHPTQTWSCSSAASLNPQGSSETDSCRTWETEVWPRQQTLNVWVFSETRLVFNRDELEILLKSSTFSLSFFFFFFKLYFLSL